VSSINEYERKINRIQPIVDEMNCSLNRIQSLNEKGVHSATYRSSSSFRRSQTEDGEDRGVVSVISLSLVC